MDRPVLVHPLVHVAEELEPQPGAQVRARIDGGAVLGPGRVQDPSCGLAETVAVIVGVQGAVQEQDALGQGVGEVVLGRVEDALALRAEAAEGHAEGEAQVIGRGLGVVFRLVGRQRCAFGAVDGSLCPGLGVAPRRNGRAALNSTEGSRWDS